jgi:hypothetical protein
VYRNQIAKKIPKLRCNRFREPTWELPGDLRELHRCKLTNLIRNHMA